jgi:GNAT superfamily N-acetyltransferase
MVRRARADDAEAIAVLSGELGYPAGAEQMQRRLDAVLERQADMAVYVVEEDGRVAGWIHMFACRRLEDDLFAEIGGLIVAAGRRSRGIGAELIAAGEEWARILGCTRIVVRSNVIRERAHRFYERAGYTKFKQQAVFSKPLRRD